MVERSSAGQRTSTQTSVIEQIEPLFSQLEQICKRVLSNENVDGLKKEVFQDGKEWLECAKAEYRMAERDEDANLELFEQLQENLAAIQEAEKDALIRPAPIEPQLVQCFPPPSLKYGIPVQEFVPKPMLQPLTKYTPPPRTPATDRCG